MSRLCSARSASAKRTVNASRPSLKRLNPDRPGCRSAAAPNKRPSLVEPAFFNAVGSLRVVLASAGLVKVDGFLEMSLTGAPAAAADVDLTQRRGSHRSFRGARETRTRNPVGWAKAPLRRAHHLHPDRRWRWWARRRTRSRPVSLP